MNIFFAVAICALTALIAGLGGHLAATKSWHKWVFWGGGLLTVILVACQAVANERQSTKSEKKQDELNQQVAKLKDDIAGVQKQLDENRNASAALLTTMQITEKNTEREAYVVWPHAIQVTSLDPLVLGIPFSNSGGEAARDIVNDGKVFLGATSNTDQEARRLKKEFEYWWRHPGRKHWNMNVYAPGNTQGFFSMDGLALSPQEKQKLLNKELTFYIFVRIIYSDHSGRWAFDACYWVQEAGRDLSITHPCSINNNPRYAIQGP